MVSGIVLLRKDAEADAALKGIHKKIAELNDHILPAGVKIDPLIDRSDLVRFTTDTVLHNLTEGFILVTIVLILFLGNVRAALIVAATIPFSLLFASICLQLKARSGKPLIAGSFGFRHGRGWRSGHGGKHRPASGPARRSRRGVGPRTGFATAAHEVQRPVFYAITIIITAYLPIFTLQRVEGRLFRPMAWTVAFALLGAVIFSMTIAPVLASLVFRKGTREWRESGAGLDYLALPACRHVDGSSPLGDGRGLRGRGRLQPLADAGRKDRVGIPAAPGRGRAVGARHAGSQHRTHGRHPAVESGAHHPVFVSRSHAMLQSDGASGRRRATPPASLIPSTSPI